MTRKTTTTFVLLRIVEETDDKPSLPPMPVVDTTAEPVPETIRPLAKVLPLSARARKVAG